MKTRKCFVIGPMNDMHIKHLHWLAEDVIRSILDGEDFAIFTPDVKEAGNIMNHIIRSADRSDLVIADTTGNNPNVLYEIAVLDAMGKVCVPVKLVEPNEEEDDKIPFDRAQYRYFRLVKGDTQSAIKELGPVIKNALKGQREGNVPENPLTDFFGFPLSSLSSAHGIARGYFRNFVLGCLRGEIIDGPAAFVGARDLVLECIIPSKVDHGTRECVADIMKSGHMVPVVLQALGRRINSCVWCAAISPEPILVDVPTALGQLRDNIKSRLGKSAMVDSNSEEFQELQADEIGQFVRYLSGFVGKEDEPMVRKRFKIIKVDECRFPSIISD